MTYAGVGVSYDAMDPFKQAAQIAGRRTASNLRQHGFSEAENTRGESVYLVEGADFILAQQIEGLGTKNLVADALAGYHYDAIAQDCVAMIVNDLVTSGAQPLMVQMHLATGNGSWFKDRFCPQDLIRGWAAACNLAGCSWGGGETATLKGIIQPGTIELSGSATGIVKPKERLIRGDVADGDAIVLIGSSGIHANGATMARQIAERKDPFWHAFLNMLFERRFPIRRLPDGYMTMMGDGQKFGEALLAPTIIYVPLVQACLDAGITIHYAVNITGGGWLKLMRHPRPFTYLIEDIPKPQEVFTFMQQHGPVSDREAYKTFNMGAGFALYVPQDAVHHVLGIAETHGFKALCAGRIVMDDFEKKLVIRPKDLVYYGWELGVR